MSDSLEYVSQENEMQQDIEHSELNTEIALIVSEPFDEPDSPDVPVQNNFLYGTQYSADSNVPKSILRAEGLNKSFRKKQAVKDVSFSMAQGEVVGLLGPNGAGKTTSFYMIVGFYTPNSGGIYLDDRRITELPMYKRARIGISYLPQEASVFRKLSVEQNIDAILETRKDLSRAERKEKLDSLLEEFGITANRKQPAYTLSGGERRRTEIARALAIEPKFLLLDEPFAGIDPIAVHDIKLIIRLLARQNIGVLITDHNVRDTLEITDRAYIINKGEIVEQGPRDKILESEIARKVYLGEEFRM
ncbi:LPS export ABC transporter ATP-binding protein [Treponema vincentii]|uniref:LPS export ABC transporter ATP-binding protein n=1 Tax=Treponema vincentii TaxID=69710 RepID=UPI0020A287A3|nr:LPS export ABC transporter ATP-binding protein [Treponema vincentii]UTC48677.1 LPS export ABC transporter ATP-binding protein [Treponema vincentii]